MHFRKKRQPEPPRRRASSARIEEEGNKFRRSATLTGTLSDQVRAGAESNGQLQTARMEAQTMRKKHRRVMRQVSVLCGLVLLLVVLFMNHVSSFAVRFGGGTVHLPPTIAYEATAKQFRSSSPGNSFVFSLDADALSQYLIAHHHEISSVKVIRHPFSRSVDLAVTLRQPVLMWQTSHENQAFYVDANGISFSFDGYTNRDAKLVHVNDESSVPAQLGVPVASSRQISFLGQLVGQIATSAGSQLTVSKIVFPPSSTKEIDVYLTGKPYFVKVYLDRSGKAQAEELIKAVSYLQQKGTQPSQYIDVRVPERVFYK